jgi:DNA ligase (NAD+)
MCPKCEFPTTFEMTTKNEESVFLVCTNSECESKLFGNIKKWLDAHECKGIGPSTIDTLIEEGLVTSLIDFLYFPYNEDGQETLMNLEGMGESKLKIINKQIENSCNTALIEFIHGMNFKGIGKDRIEAVLSHMAKYVDKITIQSFIDFVHSDNMIGVDKFGEGLIKHFRKQLIAKDSIIDRALCAVTIKNPEVVAEKSDLLKDKTFCFTGNLETMNRKDAEKLVKANGGGTGGVSKKLSYLVCNDTNSTSGKMKKAKTLEISVITEIQFLEMLGMEVPIDEPEEIIPEIVDNDLIVDIGTL